MASTNQKNRRLGRYELKEEIGRGGMATVYRGYDSSLKRNVAVKVLHPHLITHKEARARFEREARSVARLHHHSIVEIYDYAEAENGDVYIVMELVDGYTLRDFLNSRVGQPLMAEGAALIARQIFTALQIAHEEGIVHRDVKPENILIGKSGQIQLSDFGIAFLAGIGQMTATGQILGSPTYMSPEHIESPSVDARADIFSVGTILYEMAVGQPPFIGNNPHQIIKRVVEGYYDHPLSVNPSVGHPVSSVIVKCLQQQPERRYQSAAEAVTDLETILNQMGIDEADRAQKLYVNNPAEWEETHLPAVVARTLQMGKDAQKSKHLPLAMNHLNRVLAIEPTNDIALSMVNVLSRRRRLKRNMERIGGVAAISVIVIAIVLAVVMYRYGKSSDAQARDQVAFSKDMPNPPETEGTGEIPREAVSAEKRGKNGPREESVSPNPDRGTTKRVVIIKKDTEVDSPLSRVIISDSALDNGSERVKKQRTSPTDPPPTRRVIFNPLPMSVDIVIDDVQKFTFKATDRARDLSIGSHTIQFIPADDRLEPLTRTIDVVESESPLTVPARLRWKPGTLLIKSNVNADLAVNGRSLGSANEPIEIDIKKGPSTSFEILLSARGYHPIEKLVSVSAGKTTEFVVQLEKEQP
ncbi:MAG: serine/threonine protein kinase [Deltaproteobacteria bacterium]|nr:serine/threonine protein kinase [Deltaproteobacteria bacterium]